MRYLYVDTSSSYLYSAIAEDNNILASVSEEFGQSLSEVALPKIVELFEKSNLEPKDINKIIVVDGPGSFTGIRIGITIAKVYAWSMNIEITTITSLEAMALSNEEKKVHIPIINARRGFIFGAIYDENNKELLKPQHIKLESLLEKVSTYKDYVLISNDEFDDLETVKYQPNFSVIINKFKDKKAINPHAINPEYLKLTEAEENKNDHRT